MSTTRKLMQAGFVLGLVIVFAWRCKNKDKPAEPKDQFFPAIPYIKSQIAKVDTSLYSIMRIVPVDSTHNDTTYLRREQFKDAASEFLALPDITQAEYNGRFTEQSTFDESLGRVVMIYSPKDAQKEEVQRQEVLIKTQSGASEDQVTNIIFIINQSNKDSSIEKKMLWKVDESFQVTTTKQYPGKPEVTSTYKVSWNESEQ
jgi:hypothetical protein